MGRRLPGLADIDPLSAPLPHGTEVTTRVERRRCMDDRPHLHGAVSRDKGSGAQCAAVDSEDGLLCGTRCGVLRHRARHLRQTHLEVGLHRPFLSMSAHDRPGDVAARGSADEALLFRCTFDQPLAPQLYRARGCGHLRTG